MHKLESGMEVRSQGGRRRAAVEPAACGELDGAVLDLVAREHGVTVTGLCQRTRGCLAVCNARHVAMYLLHVVLSRTLTEVGAVFGRDRTSVAHACHRIEDFRDKAWFDAEMARLEAQVLALQEADGAQDAAR